VCIRHLTVEGLIRVLCLQYFIPIVTMSAQLTYWMRMANNYTEFYNTEAIIKSASLTTLRAFGIEIIRQMCSVIKLTAIVRDTSVQIFDRYLSRRTVNNLMDENMISLIATCTVILGAKLDNQRTPITMKKMRRFNIEELVKMENEILCTIEFTINPLMTPSSFVSCLLQPLDNPFDVHTIIINCDYLISEFMREIDYLLHAPPIIAISAIHVSMSQMRYNNAQWLQTIHNYIHTEYKHMDICRCLQKVRRLAASKREQASKINADLAVLKAS